jgi:hypothetical protein
MRSKSRAELVQTHKSDREANCRRNRFDLQGRKIVRKLLLTTALSLSVVLAGTCAQATVTLVAQGVVDNISPEWMPYWLAFHIAGSGSCNGWIWYSGDSAASTGITGSVEFVYSEVLSSKLFGTPVSVWADPSYSACDSYTVHMGP